MSAPPSVHRADQHTRALSLPALRSQRPAQLLIRPAARDAGLDNLRFMAAALVVCGHFCAPILDRSDLAGALLFSTWAWRIPVLVVVAGFFSSSEPLDRRQTVTLVRNVVLVYLVFDAIGRMVTFWATGTVVYDPSNPSFGMWFLLSLACWRIALPHLATVRWLPAVSVGAAVGVGFIDTIGYQFSASRTIVYLPLFLLGQWLRKGGLDRLRSWPAITPLAACTLLLVTAAFLALKDRVPLDWLAMRFPYTDDAPLAGIHQAPMRLVLLAGAALAVLSLIVLAPRCRIPGITYLGSGSMYAYLLHLPIWLYVDGAGLYAGIDSLLEVLLLIVGSLTLAAVLASRPTRTLLGWLVQPRVSWMFREHECTGATDRSAGRPTSR